MPQRRRGTQIARPSEQCCCIRRCACARVGSAQAPRNGWVPRVKISPSSHRVQRHQHVSHYSPRPRHSSPVGTPRLCVAETWCYGVASTWGQNLCTFRDRIPSGRWRDSAQAPHGLIARCMRAIVEYLCARCYGSRAVQNRGDRRLPHPKQLHASCERTCSTPTQACCTALANHDAADVSCKTVVALLANVGPIVLHDPRRAS